MDLFFLLPKSVQTGLFHIDEATFLKMKRFIDQIDITRDPIRNGFKKWPWPSAPPRK